MTVLADSIAELAEFVVITLTHVTTVGIQDLTRGAIIDSKRARAVLTILPNDSPYGVVGWHAESLFVKVTEPEGRLVLFSCQDKYLWLSKSASLQTQLCGFLTSNILFYSLKKYFSFEQNSKL